MTKIELTPEQEAIDIQWLGSIYVRMTNYYTATVRDLRSFVDYINKNREKLEKLEITNVYNVSDEFLEAVKDIIEKTNNPKEDSSWGLWKFVKKLFKSQ